MHVARLRGGELSVGAELRLELLARARRGASDSSAPLSSPLFDLRLREEHEALHAVVVVLRAAREVALVEVGRVLVAARVLVRAAHLEDDLVGLRRVAVEREEVVAVGDGLVVIVDGDAQDDGVVGSVLAVLVASGRRGPGASTFAVIASSNSAASPKRPIACSVGAATHAPIGDSGLSR